MGQGTIKREGDPATMQKDPTYDNVLLDIYDFLVAQAKELANKPEVLPPLLTGDDLIELGMSPGPELGRMLNELRDLQLQEDIKTVEHARQWVRARVATSA